MKFEIKAKHTCALIELVPLRPRPHQLGQSDRLVFLVRGWHRWGRWDPPLSRTHQCPHPRPMGVGREGWDWQGGRGCGQGGWGGRTWVPLRLDLDLGGAGGASGSSHADHSNAPGGHSQIKTPDLIHSISKLGKRIEPLQQFPMTELSQMNFTICLNSWNVLSHINSITSPITNLAIVSHQPTNG